MIAAIPMGKLGDRYGRKKILALALIGVFGSLLEIFIVCMYMYPRNCLTPLTINDT